MWLALGFGGDHRYGDAGIFHYRNGGRWNFDFLGLFTKILMGTSGQATGHRKPSAAV
jgi:hypothetical protein